MSGGRLGLRESNQALQELKTKLEFALSRLNDQDTQRTGVEEIRGFLQTLYPDWFPIVISCIGEAGTNLKPLGRCESVKLLGLLAELHGDAVVPLLPRILQVVVTRLQDSDLHLREACAETVFRLARALVVDADNTVFATLLKPLFGALGEHSKWVQIGAAAGICSVIQGSPSSVIRENLGRLSSRLVQFLSLPLAMARPQLLCACVYAMQAVEGADFDEVLPDLMPCLETCLKAQTDWQTRKQAVEVLQTIGDNPALGQTLELPPPSHKNARPTPLQKRIAGVLEVAKTDKVRAVREAVKDVLLAWSVTKAQSTYSTAIRSGSPGATRPERDAAPEREQGEQPGPSRQRAAAAERSERPERATAARSPSPTMGRPDRGNNVPPRDGAGVSPGTTDVAVSVVAPKRRGVDEDDFDCMDEKTAKKQAIKEALSNAALNVTKKPRPKKERQSLFKGPANAGFFTATPKGAHTRSAPAVATMAEMDEGDVGSSQQEEFDDGPSEGQDADDILGEDEDEEDEEDIDEVPPPRLMPASAGSRAAAQADAPERLAARDRAQDSPPVRGAQRRTSPRRDRTGELPDSRVVSTQRAVPRPRQGLRNAGPTAPDEAEGSSWPDNMCEDEDTPQLQTPSTAAALLRGDAEAELAYSNDEEAYSHSPTSWRPPLEQRGPSSPFDFEETTETPGAAGQPRRVNETGRDRAAASRGGRAPGARSSPNASVDGAWDWDDQPPSQQKAPGSGGWDDQPVGPKPPARSNSWEEVPIGSRRAAAANNWEEQPVGSKKAAATTGWDEQPVGAKGKTAASSWEEKPVGPRRANSWSEQPGHEREADPKPRSPGPADGNGSLDIVMAELDAFRKRLKFLEEEKRETEDGLVDRLRILERTCASQQELLAAQEQRLEAQAHAAQQLEQQLRQIEQRGQQQEQRTKEQERRLHQQETQLQQQDQLFDQQEQVLKEHEQQMEQQEGTLEQHKLLIDELLASQPEVEDEDVEEGDEDADDGVGEPIWRGEPAPRAITTSTRLGMYGDTFESPAGSRLAPAALPMKSASETSALSSGLTGSGLAGSSGERPPVSSLREGGSVGPSLLKIDGLGGVTPAKQPPPKKMGILWEKVVQLCEEQRFLEAYKQAIAEPEESCLLRLMQHTGPIVERLDAESNSRLIRRLIHILSSPSKEPAAICIEQIFAWLWQALDVGIHFTTSQVEDLAAALQKASAPSSPLPPAERTDAGRLLQRVSALRRG